MGNSEGEGREGFPAEVPAALSDSGISEDEQWNKDEALAFAHAAIIAFQGTAMAHKTE